MQSHSIARARETQPYSRAAYEQALLDSPHLPDQAFRLAFILAECGGDEGVVEGVTQRTLNERVGRPNLQWAHRWLRYLAKNGWVRYETRGRKHVQPVLIISVPGANLSGGKEKPGRGSLRA